MNVILVERAEVEVDGVVRLTGDRAAHVAGVLRAIPGQTIRIGILDGPFGVGTVESAGAGEVAMRCVFETAIPSVPRVDLLLALPRPKVMRRLWSQLAALGVGRLILTNAARVERHYFDTHVLDPTTYVPLLREGLQQARDTRLPEVEIHRRLKVLVEDHLDTLCPSGVRLLAEPGAGQPLRHALGAGREPNTTNAAPRVLVAMGPEGGWTSFELALLAAHRFTTVSLGPRTLRSDTAAIALLTLVHDALEHG